MFNISLRTDEMLIVSKLAFYTQFNLQKPYKVSDELSDFSEDLLEVGVRIEQWKTISHHPRSPLREQDVFKIYADEIHRVKTQFGYHQADFSTMKPDDAFAISVRGRYLSEHTHDEDEVRFFLSGRMLIYLHVNQKIHILECTKGDFVLIPAGVKHWIDIGPSPEFSVIRWFNSKKAFSNQFTEGLVAEATPRWETIYAEEHFKK